MKYSEYFKNRAELSREKIDETRDFDKLLSCLKNDSGSPETAEKNSGTKKNDFPDNKFGIKKLLLIAGGFAATLVIVWVLLDRYQDTSSVAQEQQSETNVAKVNPPLNGIDLPWTTALINPSKDTSLLIGSSLIYFPAGATKMQDGSDPGDSITIRYREFLDVADIFISGIPMTYDSAGVSYTFESAGMFELRATLGEEELIISEERKIEVSLLTPWMGNRFNQYRLNEITGKWEFLGIDRQEVSDLWFSEVWMSEDGLNGLIEEYQELENRMASPEADINTPAPIKPELADSKKQTLALRVDLKHFPELAPYDGFKFEILDPGNFDGRKSESKWNNIDILRSSKEGEYILRFWLPGEEYDVLVKPVLSEKDYAKAIKTYEKLFAEYQLGVEKREKESLQMKEAYETERKKIIQERQRIILAIAEQQRNLATSADLNYHVNRVFSLASFGYYNSDCPVLMPKGVEVQLNPIAQQTGAPIGNGLVYLVETNRNAVYSFYPGSKLSFNPSEKNIAWMVTSDGRLAIADVAEFAKVDPGRGSCDMKFKVFDKKPKTPEEVRIILSPYVQL